jgi:cytochrome-b5 reductase
VIKEVLRLKAAGDTTQVRLMYANRKEEDILLRDQLDRLSSDNDNFSVEYILSQPSAQWQGKTGHIGASRLETFLPAPSSNILVYVCGPPGFMQAVSGDKLPSKEQGSVGGALRALGYSGDLNSSRTAHIYVCCYVHCMHCILY